MHRKIAVVIPSWNGREEIGDCLRSLEKQTVKHQVIIVENGSTDGSLEYIQENFTNIDFIINQKNLGFAGGVNCGIRRALEQRYDYVALFNNDAVADKDWLKELAAALDARPEVGIATCKFMDIKREHLDSTGDLYTVWGLPFPRGRGEPASTTTYDDQNYILGATGGATMFRAEVFREVGLFDEDFFAYYEDVDISLRAQLAGWKVYYNPQSKAYHQISATSSRIPGFTTRQTIKNYPWILWKNMPFSILIRILPRFSLAYLFFVARAFQRGQGKLAIQGIAKSLWLMPKKLAERYRIQKNRKVTPAYIWNILTHDLPPNANKLRTLRDKYWTIKRRTS